LDGLKPFGGFPIYGLDEDWFGGFWVEVPEFWKKSEKRPKD